MVTLRLIIICTKCCLRTWQMLHYAGHTFLKRHNTACSHSKVSVCSVLVTLVLLIQTADESGASAVWSRKCYGFTPQEIFVLWVDHFADEHSLRPLLQSDFIQGITSVHSEHWLIRQSPGHKSEGWTALSVIRLRTREWCSPFACDGVKRANTTSETAASAVICLSFIAFWKRW